MLWDLIPELTNEARGATSRSSKREVTRTRVRVRTATAAQTRQQSRYLRGRPPYGYQLADAGPQPNKAHAAWDRRAHRLEPDPETARLGDQECSIMPRMFRPALRSSKPELMSSSA